jgi:hypothetical protein
MKVTYRLNRRDIFFGNVQQLFYQPVVLVFFAGLFTVISYRNWQAIPPDKTLLVKFITFIILEIIPVLWITAVLGLYLFFIILSRRNKTLLVEQTITLNEDNMISQSEYGRSEITWKAVQRVVRTRNYLFLYLSQVGACLIPKRAFNSKEECDNFVNFCIEKSRNG